jgi:lipoyltransferase 1
MCNFRPKRIHQIDPSSIWTEPAARKSGGKKAEQPFRDPIRQVFISQSTDVFSNLALEDWIYRNHDFDHKVWSKT